MLPCGCWGKCCGRAYHASEASRIQDKLDQLGPGFSAEGPVRWILRGRVEDERHRALLAGEMGR